MSVKPLSILTAVVADQLADSQPIFVKNINGFTLTANLTDDSFLLPLNGRMQQKWRFGLLMRRYIGNN